MVRSTNTVEKAEGEHAVENFLTGHHFEHPHTGLVLEAIRWHTQARRDDGKINFHRKLNKKASKVCFEHKKSFIARMGRVDTLDPFDDTKLLYIFQYFLSCKKKKTT
jgi:extradiol dioxygenase family protein